MKFLSPLLLVALIGCSSQPASTPTAETKMSSQQKIDKIQNDAKKPDGLKQIQIHTIEKQSGTAP